MAAPVAHTEPVPDDKCMKCRVQPHYGQCESSEAPPRELRVNHLADLVHLTQAAPIALRRFIVGERASKLIGGLVQHRFGAEAL